ncbi:hypothetical protein CXB51_017007 [Gossypium anomalum]|uniref:Piwi domain-containing protein n=1 Tax=Gossypium anomalum TaxID=47600 RepID=A0A8J5YU50_9ROSI|nr:hypothetical protein CXB51_017007 [Gossypium anomalum]
MTETGKIGIRNYRLLSMLTLGQTPSIPVVSKVPTIILGMGALFGFPEQSNMLSIAAMVSSRRGLLISSYGASGRTQSLKLKMIDSFFKTSFKVDDGIMKEALLNFYTSSGKRKPDQIIIFRDGGSPDNVLHGTVIVNKVCHPKNNGFYLGTHAGMIGITRQTHYHVLLDQAGFSADDLQEFVHSLSYMYQRSSTAIFFMAPICYAHLATSQLGAIYEDSGCFRSIIESWWDVCSGSNLCTSAFQVEG